MRHIFQFHKKYPGKITVLLAFSFFVSGCHIGNESATVAQIATKKEKTDQYGTTEVKRKPLSENDLRRKQNRPVPSPNREKTNNYTTAERDPFDLPAEMQKPKSIPAFKCIPIDNNKAPAQAVPPFTLAPCVAGIFDNGKEKFALVRWQQVQGVFRCGERLGNGYFVKEITANSVLLYPEQNRPGTDSVTLTLH